MMPTHKLDAVDILKKTYSHIFLYLCILYICCCTQRALMCARISFALAYTPRVRLPFIQLRERARLSFIQHYVKGLHALPACLPRWFVQSRNWQRSRGVQNAEPEYRNERERQQGGMCEVELKSKGWQESHAKWGVSGAANVVD